MDMKKVLETMADGEPVYMEEYHVYMLDLEHPNRFMGLDWWEKRGDTLTLDQYKRTYANKVETQQGCSDMELLEDVYYTLNMNHPEDYKLPSLSVGDVIEVRGNYYFCDRIGWKKVDLK